ncbi:MAG: SMC-Scp complex subunit ScpB [Phycisphaerae bacterium]
MEDVIQVMDLPEQSAEHEARPYQNDDGESPDSPADSVTATRAKSRKKPSRTREPVAPQTDDDAASQTLHEEFDRIVESLLFSTDAPLSPRKLADLAGCGTPAAVKEAIERLNERFETAALTFRIEAIAGGYQMLTMPRYHEWVQKLDKQRAQTRLGDAAMETLAIIAYRQPIIRADIEAIRGVATGDILARLREMGVIKIAGRAEVVGRPLLYATTPKFLDVFGLSGLEDLPPMDSPIPTLAQPAESAEIEEEIAEISAIHDVSDPEIADMNEEGAAANPDLIQSE